MTDLLPAPITLDQALQYATDIVAEAGPDYVYQRSIGDTSVHAAFIGCWYVVDKKPSCIVGRILHRHGYPIDVLLKWEGFDAITMGPAGRRATTRVLPTRNLVTEEAAQFLDHLQRKQDAGRPWGHALRMAEAGIVR